MALRSAADGSIATTSTLASHAVGRAADQAPTSVLSPQVDHAQHLPGRDVDDGGYPPLQAGGAPRLEPAPGSRRCPEEADRPVPVLVDAEASDDGATDVGQHEQRTGQGRLDCPSRLPASAGRLADRPTGPTAAATSASRSRGLVLGSRSPSWWLPSQHPSQCTGHESSSCRVGMRYPLCAAH